MYRVRAPDIGRMNVKRKALVIALVTCCVALACALTACESKTPVPDTNLEPEPVDKVDKSATAFSMKPFYALIVGNDSRDGTFKEGNGSHGADGTKRSDTMMLVRVDPKNAQITLVSIPRDTQTLLDGETVKINECYNRGGIEGSVAKVEEYTGVNIKYYYDVSFAEFVKLVDALGGCDVNVPVTMTFEEAIDGGRVTEEEGDQHLDGRHTLSFARVRKIFVNMDSSRQYDDRAIIVSLMSKVINNPGEMAAYTGDFMSIVHTNMTDAELVFYVSKFIDNAKKVKFLCGSFPADGDIDPGTQLWLAWYDPDMWAAIMKVVDEGGDPNEVYTPPFG